MKLTLIKSVSHLIIALGIGLASPAFAQDSSMPDGMPPEISDLFADAKEQGGTVTIAPSEEMPAGAAEATATAVPRYLYTTLRVITNGASRGCASGNWNCMTNLCKADLQSQSAWRGWAGCWKKNNSYICYFECGQVRNAF